MCLCVCERVRKRNVQVSISYLTISLELVGPCGDFTTMIVINRHLLNFNWPPSEAAKVAVMKAGRFLKRLLVQVIRSHIYNSAPLPFLFSLSRFIIKLILRSVIAGQCTAWLLTLATEADIIDRLKVDYLFELRGGQSARVPRPTSGTQTPDIWAWFIKVFAPTCNNVQTNVRNKRRPRKCFAWCTAYMK